jgi:hypothetical protein
VKTNEAKTKKPKTPKQNPFPDFRTCFVSKTTVNCSCNIKLFFQKNQKPQNKTPSQILGLVLFPKPQ